MDGPRYTENYTRRSGRSFASLLCRRAVGPFGQTAMRA